MSKKGFLLKLVLSILAGVLFIFSISYVMPGFENKADASEAEGIDILRSWTAFEPSKIIEKVGAAEMKAGEEETAGHSDKGVYLAVGGSVEFTFNVPDTGKYNLLLEYGMDSKRVLKSSITLSYGENESIVSVPSLWHDGNKEYLKDRYGNDIIPEQKMLEGMHFEYAKKFAGQDKSPIVFDLAQGKQKFTLVNNTQPITISAVYLAKEKQIPGYEEYLKGIPDQTTGRGLITIEAEQYLAKSDSFIRAGNDQNIALHPYNTYEKRLNILEGGSWGEAGQKILWGFEVPVSGMYSISFAYSQNEIQGMAVYRNIEIDGKIPVKELKDYAFKNTGLTYKNVIAADKDNRELKIRLEKGKHTIAMEVDAQPIQPEIDILEEIMLQINSAGIDIKKLTGGKQDRNRKWDINEYMPDIVQKMEAWAQKLEEVYRRLEQIYGEKPSFAINLKVAAGNLRDMAKKPKDIPNNLSRLSEGAGSAAQLIGELNLILSAQYMNLDRIYIVGNGEPPKMNGNILINGIEGVKRFYGTFSKKTNDSLAKEADELSVWINRPIQYVDLLQQQADSSFTPKSGIRVKLSVMPDEQKLILANASGKNPDVAMGISNYIPYQLAIRGAAADLTQFNDFLPYMSQRYNLETLIPFISDNKIYGVTETQDFYVLMYRKDILDRLKLAVPDTWEDVKNMMPELQRHSMNFFVPMAEWSGLKPFYTTSPFIYQNGGAIYSRDGLASAINTEETIKGFELMTELFTIYSVAENAPSFYNNFRYGRMPVGVSNFTTYVALMNAAPEIAGMWDIALSPGVRDKDGNVRRYQVGSDRADVIFENSRKKDGSWEFLKWWLSKDAQINFAYSLQTKFGPAYMWNTANMAAFEELPFPEKDKKVILEQWKYIKEVPPHPASYMAEREISNAWTNIVMNGAGIRTTLDKAALITNREIKLKLEEFGYFKDGKFIREYKIPTVNDLRKQVKGSK